MFLIVVEDDDGAWMSEPEVVESYREAKDAAERKVSGTVATLTVATYELREVVRSIGRQE